MTSAKVTFDYSKLIGAMAERKVTRQLLASKIPMSAPYLGQILSEGRTMSSLTIYRIAQILGLPNVDDYFFTLKVQQK